MDAVTGEQAWDAQYHSGYNSGWGSTLESTVVYRRIIESFLAQNRPQRVLDLGCGDWQFSQFIPWDDYGVLYVGVDASPTIIEKNRQRFASPSKHFHVVRQPTELAALGMGFDLVVCKDVLHHLPNAMVNGYLDAVERIAKVALITNDAYPASTHDAPAHALNIDIGDIGAGNWRALDIRKPPFSRTSFVISEYANFSNQIYVIKHVHLLLCDRARSSAA
jgi:SAM-dependent methyltransferase